MAPGEVVVVPPGELAVVVLVEPGEVVVVPPGELAVVVLVAPGEVVVVVSAGEVVAPGRGAMARSPKAAAISGIEPYWPSPVINRSTFQGFGTSRYD